MLEWILLALRVLSVIALLCFGGVLLWALWRNMQVVVAQNEWSQQSRGSLVQMMRIDKVYTPTRQLYPLRPITSIGRARSNSIVIDDPYASSEHAVIFLRDGQWWLEDRSSRNGTQLNGEKIEQPLIIADGDIISIGKFGLKLDLQRNSSSSMVASTTTQSVPAI